AWKARAFGCRTFFRLIAWELTKTAKFTACSGEREQGRDSASAWRPLATPCPRSCSNREWRSRALMMEAAVPILVFIAVSCLAFIVGLLLDQRSAQARLIRERLNAEQAEGKRER